MEFVFGNEGTEGQHHQGADGGNVRIRRVLITAKTRNTSDSTEFHRIPSPFAVFAAFHNLIATNA